MEIFFPVFSAIIAARLTEWVLIAFVKTYVPKIAEFVAIWKLWAKAKRN